MVGVGCMCADYWAGIGNLTAALKEAKMWENLIYVLSAVRPAAAHSTQVDTMMAITTTAGCTGQSMLRQAGHLTGTLTVTLHAWCAHVVGMQSHTCSGAV